MLEAIAVIGIIYLLDAEFEKLIDRPSVPLLKI